MHARYTVGSAPGAVPLLGHAVPLLRHRLRFLMSLPAHGDLVRIRMGPNPAVVVCDPDLTRQVLLDDRTFDKGGSFFERARETAGNGLATCPYSDHRRQRRLIQPAFHKTRLPAYAQTMTEHITAMADSWRDGQTIDVLAAMQNLTGRILVTTMLGDALPPAMLDEALQDALTVVSGVFARMLLPSPALDRFLPGNRRYQRARTRLRENLGTVITEHRPDDAGHDGLLSVLLADPDDRSPGLSDEEIIDQLVVFLFAGVETSSNALAWTFHLLARHPDVERRLHSELDTVLRGRRATFDDLPALDLTSRIVAESMRLYPPVWLLTRTVTKATELGGHPLPTGATVVYSPYLLHHRPDLYPDPERFDPDRWLDDPATPPPRNAYIPFSSGARQCAGDTFALTEVALTVARIAAHWQLRHIPGRDVDIVPNNAMNPPGLRMRTTLRAH